MLSELGTLYLERGEDDSAIEALSLHLAASPYDEHTMQLLESTFLFLIAAILTPKALMSSSALPEKGPSQKGPFHLYTYKTHQDTPYCHSTSLKLEEVEVKFGEQTRRNFLLGIPLFDFDFSVIVFDGEKNVARGSNGLEMLKDSGTVSCPTTYMQNNDKKYGDSSK